MSFFGKGKTTSHFFHKPSGLIGELDLRKELKKIIYDEKRGDYVVYRRARRDAHGVPMLANSSAGNRSTEILYSNNQGVRFLFDDYLIQGVIATESATHPPGTVKPYGDSRTDGRDVFVEHDILSRYTNNRFDIPDEHDKIIIPVFDIEGKLKSPLEVYEYFDIGSVETYRLNDTGRVEYFKIRLLTKAESDYKL
jgi:hypothetical protein